MEDEQDGAPSPRAGRAENAPAAALPPRLPMPAEYMPGQGALRVEIGAAKPWDPYNLRDIARLMAAVGRKSRSPSLSRTPEQIATDLSVAALDFMAWRRVQKRSTADNPAEHLHALAEAADKLLTLLEADDLHLIFDGDIWHSTTIYKLMGVSDLTLEAAEAETRKAQRFAELVAEIMERDATADTPFEKSDRYESAMRAAEQRMLRPARSETWPVLDSAARSARELVCEANEPRDFLRILRAASIQQAGRADGINRRGRPVRDDRHLFVLRLLRIYTELTGEEPGTSRGEGPKGGPAGRFVAEAVKILRERLTQEEREADTEIDADLERGCSEKAGTEWHESARKFARRLQQSGEELADIRERKRQQHHERKKKRQRQARLKEALDALKRSGKI